MLTVLLLGCFGGVATGVDTSGGTNAESGRGDLVEGVASDAGVYVIDLSTDPDPPVTGANTLHVRIGGGEDGVPVTDATLQVEPFMPAMGHGISGTPEITALGDGRFDAAWSYPMAGEWEVRLGITSDDLGADTYTGITEVQ